MKRPKYKSLKTAFDAVIDVHKARNVKKLRKDLFHPSWFPTNAKIRFHDVGPSWAGKPAISLQLSNQCRTSIDKRHKMYHFNLSPMFDLHPHVRKSTPIGFFFTSLNSKSIIESFPIFMTHRVSSSFAHGSELPYSGPPGFTNIVREIYRPGMLASRRSVPRLIEFSKRCDSEDSYANHFMEISKIAASPTAASPTMSYICRISFEKDEDPEDEGIIDSSPRQDDETLPKQEDSASQQSIAIVDCPSLAHFDEILANSHWSEYDLNNPLAAIIHLTNRDVFETESYQDWVNRFGTNCKHLVANDSCQYVYLSDEFDHASRLHMICPNLFPAAPVSECPLKSINEVDKSDQVHNGMMVSLNHAQCDIIEDDLYAQPDDITSRQARLMEISEEHSEVLNNMRANLSELKDPNSKDYYPRLHVLGSGGRHGHSLRAHVAFLLQLDKENSIVLDCGANVTKRIHQLFGKEAKRILASVKLVLLSHKHIDHHAGFQGLINAINDAGGGQKVFCLMPPNVLPIYKSFLDESSNFIRVCALSNQNSKAITVDYLGPILQHLPIQDLTPVLVNHSTVTFGIVIKTNCGKKVVYSSDTTPMAPQLLLHGVDADLMIHDCLYIEDMYETEATYRMHSTLKGALATSNAMKAKFTLLTHFAPQYPLLPTNELPQQYSKSVSFALDLLSVSLSDLHKLPHLTSALEDIFREELATKREYLRKLNLKREDRNVMIENLSALVK